MISELPVQVLPLKTIAQAIKDLEATTTPSSLGKKPLRAVFLANLKETDTSLPHSAQELTLY